LNATIELACFLGKHGQRVSEVEEERIQKGTVADYLGRKALV
jgi:hypothetical protein